MAAGLATHPRGRGRQSGNGQTERTGTRRGRNGDRNTPQSRTEATHGERHATPPRKRGGKGGSGGRIGKPDHHHRTGKRPRRTAQTPAGRTERQRVTHDSTEPRRRQRQRGKAGRRTNKRAGRNNGMRTGRKHGEDPQKTRQNTRRHEYIIIKRREKRNSLGRQTPPRQLPIVGRASGRQAAVERRH